MALNSLPVHSPGWSQTLLTLGQAKRERSEASLNLERGKRFVRLHFQSPERIHQQQRAANSRKGWAGGAWEVDAAAGRDLLLTSGRAWGLYCWAVAMELLDRPRARAGKGEGGHQRPGSLSREGHSAGTMSALWNVRVSRSTTTGGSTATSAGV